MGSFDAINGLFEPVVAPLRYMPISAFIPLLILWFGIYEKQKIAFLFLGVFVYLLPVVVSAIRAVPEELVQTALTLGASRGQVIRTVLLPAALPEIWDSFRVMNAISWTYVILAEAVNPEHGLGYMVELARTHQKASWSFAGLIVIGGIGLDPPGRRAGDGRGHRRRRQGRRDLPGEPARRRAEAAAAGTVRHLRRSLRASDRGGARRVARHRRQARGRGDRGLPRTIGLRQVDHPQGRGRPAGPHQRRGAGRGRAGDGRGAGPGHGLPGLHLVRLAHGAGERRVRAAAARDGAA